MSTAPTSRPVILVVGPTAGGKTDLSIALAEQLPGGGECLCADSMQVYRGMDLGTAKPTESEQARVPHHLLDLVEPDDETFNVDRWLELADETIEAVRKRGRWPVIVGGTNLYIQALLHGLAAGPEPDPALRAELERLDPTKLRAWLERVDPESAARIHPNDRKRTIRAIEVHERSGQPISQLHADWQGAARRRDLVMIGLDWPVEAINRRINERVKRMMDAGLVDEVRRLVAGPGLGRQAREALGYQQILEHLESGITLEDAFEQIKIRTRRFGKQQRTWLRRFRTWNPSVWLPADTIEPELLVQKAITFAIEATPGDLQPANSRDQEKPSSGQAG